MAEESEAQRLFREAQEAINNGTAITRKSRGSINKPLPVPKRKKVVSNHPEDRKSASAKKAHATKKFRIECCKYGVDPDHPSARRSLAQHKAAEKRKQFYKDNNISLKTRPASLPAFIADPHVKT